MTDTPKSPREIAEETTEQFASRITDDYKSGVIDLDELASQYAEALQTKQDKVETLSHSALSRRVELQQEQIEELRKALNWADKAVVPEIVLLQKETIKSLEAEIERMRK